jgi:hypothetical protein
MAAVNRDNDMAAATSVSASDEPRVVTSRTCEVRWINRGPAPAAVVEWFARLETALEDRDDNYLVSPRLPDVSVKIRGTESFDVKARRGAVGDLELRGHGVAAVIESWEKVSLPLSSAPVWAPGQHRPTWRMIRKHRRIASFPIDGFLLPGWLARGDRCAAELTDFRAEDDPWWTLAIEASGEHALTAVRGAAAGIFAEQPPMQVFGLAAAASYAAWLERQRI